MTWREKHRHQGGQLTKRTYICLLVEHLSQLDPYLWHCVYTGLNLLANTLEQSCK